MTDRNDLTELIDKLITERTFSVEGVKAIEALRIKAEAQSAELKRKDDAIESNRKTISNLEAGLDSARTEIERINKDLADLRARESKIADHEKARAVAEATASAYKDAMQIVFKPNTVRETIFDSVPIAQAQPGGYSTVQSYATTKSVTREEGT